MPRKIFINDLQAVIAEAKVPQISHVQLGDEDGSFNFVYHMACNHHSIDLSIHVLIPDVSEYPYGHQCLLYTTSDYVPKNIAQAIEALRFVNSPRISELLHRVVKILDLKAELHALETSFTTGNNEPATTARDDSFSSPHEEMEENEWSDDLSAEPWSPISPRLFPVNAEDAGGNSLSILSQKNHRLPGAGLRAISDLRLTKEAGFRIGFFGDLENANDSNLYLTVSLRIKKLEISDEVLRAWGLEDNKYLVLMMNYSSKYQTLDSLLKDLGNKRSDNLDMRVGICRNYKPTFTEMKKVFTQHVRNLSPTTRLLADVQGRSIIEGSGKGTLESNESANCLERIFIEGPLNELLNTWLLSLITVRMRHSMSWRAAEAYFYDCQQRGVSSNVDSSNPSDYFKYEDDQNRFPKIAAADHLREASSGYSFPLIAMQFLLRHLLRCPEFCLVCHCRMESQLEALKPYVCSKGLCLYQYMTLGFGPSIEFEIASSPNVADLLISFCYVSASLNRLDDFPNGMNLMVPNLEAFSSNSINLTRYNSHKARFDRKLARITFTAATAHPFPLKPGDWILVVVTDSSWVGPMYHCRVSEISSFPLIHLSGDMYESTSNEKISGLFSRASKTSQTGKKKGSTVVEEDFDCLVLPYDYSFDKLKPQSKKEMIPYLLDTLPSIKEMSKYLSQNPGRSLRQWHERISPAAMGVLRWIIASNRSCIVEVTKLDSNGQITPGSHPEQQVRGMESWMQFRFAQGAPDKEARFQDSVQNATKRLGLTYPTIFAWHGSRLANWHSIVRKGLNFNETVNGRAFGHGVYHSLFYNISISYSTVQSSNITWPQSFLKVKTAICLNEIVNAPKEFVSSKPHLVVSQLDWIQTRFLFVKCDDAQTPPTPPLLPPHLKHILEQDPSKHAFGETGLILIPFAAVKKTRRFLPNSVKKGNKKVKLSHRPAKANANQAHTEEQNKENINDRGFDDSSSVASDPEDLNILQLDDFSTDQSPDKEDISDLTEFTPGQLDATTLPLLGPPRYATPIATKALQRELQAILKIQNNEPQHRRGWSLDPQLVQNVYQWIIELHSFDLSLPLAKDMKQRGVSSIVLEMRFGPGYPMSPPFVRVIRPRFLPFMSGGGGHVTAGGALCMELLTNTGWSAVSSIESVIVQVRVAISSLEPRPARLEAGPVKDYNINEAASAYIRACQTHGWEVPKEFNQLVSGI
ncbi:hypothetical protein L228DRAFT_280539 [Xylona heveae TC161]|uniref:UBC core domain-containing protein n=1 Tax=Xylona heveae (strain CBS 132557 / TC161) TaxID=1328760 RepID=A0A161TGJ4_XYLHT|nr:hypothetical protein L228DRAFT_280539 [Xylona heveae TC161]KZF25287.1 hypothetical protein L228DRAFT_280539 [Xylona heveae TC161]